MGKRPSTKPKKRGIDPDVMYAMSLLESTGICVVPSSGFTVKEEEKEEENEYDDDGESSSPTTNTKTKRRRRRKRRYGFRTTFLPPESDMKRSVEAMKVHHEQFC